MKRGWVLVFFLGMWGWGLHAQSLSSLEHEEFKMNGEQWIARSNPRSPESTLLYYPHLGYYSNSDVKQGRLIGVMFVNSKMVLIELLEQGDKPLPIGQTGIMQVTDTTGTSYSFGVSSKYREVLGLLGDEYRTMLKLLRQGGPLDIDIKLGRYTHYSYRIDGSGFSQLFDAVKKQLY